MIHPHAPDFLLAQSDMTDRIGAENILPNVNAALERAEKVFIDFGGVGAEFAKDMTKLGI